MPVGLACRTVDVLHVLAVQYFEAADGMGTIITAFTGHLVNFLVCDFASDEFVYASRHADGPEEAFQCFDAGQGCFFC